MGQLETQSSSVQHEHLRDYAWNYFELHAEQRLKAFQFYISLSTALVGGFVILIRYNNTSKWMAVLGMLLAFLSFIFWKLDERTKSLVHNAEEALKYLDGQQNLSDIEGVPHPLRVFSRDDHITSQAALYPPWSGHFSYSRCFRWIYIVFALSGAVSSIWCLLIFPL